MGGILQDGRIQEYPYYINLEADIMAERIYITEDDDSIRELVTVALSAYSYEVESSRKAGAGYIPVRHNAAGYGRCAGSEDSS